MSRIVNIYGKKYVVVSEVYSLSELRIVFDMILRTIESMLNQADFSEMQDEQETLTNTILEAMPNGIELIEIIEGEYLATFV